MNARLWQARQGPRILVEVEYDDVLDPETLAKLVVPVARRFHWKVWRTVLVWWFRDRKRKAVFKKLDARQIAEDPTTILLAIANSMASSAIASGYTADLPRQFFTSGLVGPNGQPLFNVPPGKPGSN